MAFYFLFLDVYAKKTIRYFLLRWRPNNANSAANAQVFCRTAQDCTLSLRIYSACTPCGPFRGDWTVLTGRDWATSTQMGIRQSYIINLSMVAFLYMYTYSATGVSYKHSALKFCSSVLRCDGSYQAVYCTECLQINISERNYLWRSVYEIKNFDFIFVHSTYWCEILTLSVSIFFFTPYMGKFFYFFISLLMFAFFFHYLHHS
jgi:hypothetical protein